jgi:YVTN family beta-propeller protein
MTELPRGAVTFLFSDIEGSTRLVRHFRERWGDVLGEHQRLLRTAFAEHHGHEVDTQGDSFFVAFASARDAVLAAVDAQRALRGQEWPDETELEVRMGVHTGQAVLNDGRYTGLAVHRAARIGAAANGGQILVSQATQTLLEDEEEDLGISLRDLGEQRLKDLERPVRLYQVEADGLQKEFPPLRHEAQLAQAAEVALRASPAVRWRLVLGALVVLAAAIVIPFVLLSGGGATVTVRPNSVGVIDPNSNRVVAQVQVGARPGPITAGGGAIWVGNQDDRTLSRIDPKSLSTSRTISLGRTPTDVAYGEGAVWVANGLLGTVERVDPSFNTVGNPIDARVGNAVDGSIAVGFGSVWFASANSTIARIDPDSGRVTDTLVGGYSPSAIAVGEGHVWVANAGDNTVYEISPATNQPVAKPGVSRGPTAVTVGGGGVWVASGIASQVTRIDPAAGTTVTAIPVGNHPSAIAYGGGAVWVANADDGTVSRIDPANNAVTKTIKIGNAPQGIVVSDNRVWVAVDSP